MAKKYPGLYLYFDWLECIESMGAKEGYRMVMNLYHYVKDGVRPDPLRGTNNLVQNICLAQIDRSKERGEIGRLGAEARYGTTGQGKRKPREAEVEIPAELLESGLEIDPNDDMDELLLINRAMRIGMSKSSASTPPTPPAKP